MLNTETNFSYIYHPARKKLGLNAWEYMVADLIHQLSHSAGYSWCVATKEDMAESLGISKRNLLRIIDKLIKKQLIKKSSNKKLRTTHIWFQEVVLQKQRGSQLKSDKVALFEDDDTLSPENEQLALKNDNFEKKVDKTVGKSDKVSPNKYNIYNNNNTDNIYNKIKNLKIDKSKKEELNNIFKIIEKHKIYKVDMNKDIKLFKELLEEFPQVDIPLMLKDLYWWNQDHPRKKINARSQIRNWCTNAVKFNKNLKGETNVQSNSTSQNPGVAKTPSQYAGLSTEYDDLPKVQGDGEG